MYVDLGHIKRYGHLNIQKYGLDLRWLRKLKTKLKSEGLVQNYCNYLILYKELQ